jgi:hypothetical protein
MCCAVLCGAALADVYCDRRLPGDVRCHEVLLGECLGGALYINDFLQLAAQVGKGAAGHLKEWPSPASLWGCMYTCGALFVVA